MTRLPILFMMILWPALGNAQGYICAVGGGAEDYNAWSDAPYRWMVQRADSQRIIVLSANTETQWIPDYFTSFGADTAFNLRIGSTSVANDSATYRAITQSRGVFIKGGDQWDYVNYWRGTLTQQAIREVFLAGGVVGGTSAGAMVLGDVVSDAQFGSVLSRTVLRNPRSSTLTLTTNFLRLVPNSVFDTHFFERGRTGRLFAMLGKYYADTGQRILGMGIETSTAVCISPDGTAEVMGGGSVSFYYPTEQSQVVAVANQPLVLTYLKYDALVSGYKYNINSHEVTYVPPSAVVPGAGSSAPSVNAITLFGDAFPVSAGLTQFVNDAGGVSSRFVVIVPPASSSSGQRYVDSLVSRGVASALLLLLDLAGSNNSTYASQVLQAHGIIFAANYSESFPSFVDATTLVGQALRTKLTAGIAVAYAASDAKFAGTKVVFRTELEELASWKGKLLLGNGLTALRNLLVMPLIFQSDVYDENRTTGLTWGMAKADGKTGMYVDEGGYVSIAPGGDIRSQGPSPAIVVDTRNATRVGFSTYVVPGGIGPRQTTAIVGATVHVIAGAITINPLSVQPLRANVKVFLQGPYHAGSSVMDHALNTSGVLAAHFGAIPIPRNAVDSINIEIRNSVTAAGSTVRVFQPAWLLKDGSIVGFADTTQGYTTHTAAGGSYYIVVWHRNHLAIMTAAAHALSISPPPAYDFTTAQTQAYSTDYVHSPPTVQVEAGVYGMFGGDANGTGLVSAADANIIFGDLNSPGYDDNDTNLTGIVTAADANLAFGNLNAVTGVVRPGQRQLLPVIKGRK